MRRSRSFTTAALAAVAGTALLAVPASAQVLDTGTQEVTFQVSGGLLTVTAPVAVAALDVTGGALGSVTVLDARVPAANWTLGVSVSDFTAPLPGTETTGTITADKAQMWIDSGTPIVNALTTASSVYDENSKLTLSNDAQNFVTTTGSQIGNSATIVPVMSVDTEGAAAAIYTGTVTYTAS